MGNPGINDRYDFITANVIDFKINFGLIGRFLSGSCNDSGRCIEEGFTAYSKDEMQELCDEVSKIIPEVQLRGV